MLHADSHLYGHEITAAALRARFSIIAEDAWTTINTDAIFDEVPA